MMPAQRVNFERLLKPQHIAFVGGQDALVAIGEAKRIGYQGKMWAVNPRRESLGGLTCFKSVRELPAPPDAVFLAVPVEQAIATAAELGALGAGGVVCYTAGFGEIGDDGKNYEQQLLQAAGSMALIGPNCYGMINYLDRTALWPFAHGGETPGYGCAIITQSGMLSSDLTMSQRSVPLTHMISVGNQAALAIEDIIDVLCEDSRVRAIGLHIEGLKNVNRFANAAVKAATLGKPLVAFKTGSSTIGKSLTASHTGSLSGEDDLYDSLFKRCCVIRVFSPAQLLETLKFLCIAGVPEGPAVAGFTCSGGGATMLADHGEKIDLTFPAFNNTVSEQLTRLLPDIATVSNPLDYTTPIWGQAEYTRPVFSTAIKSGVDATVLVQDYPAAGLDESKSAYFTDGNAFADAALEHNIPAAICSTLPENLDIETRNHFVSRGVAPMQGINETLDAVAASVSWGRSQEKILMQLPAELLTVDCVGSTTRLSVDEATTKSWLKGAGINIPDGIVCTDEEAAAVAVEMGFPVAVKMVHKDLMHKTEAGAVQLGLASADAVSEAVKQISKEVSRHHPGLADARFLIERNIEPPIAELIVSIRQDPQFGLALTLGCGGILVELIKDVVTLLLPSSTAEILEALKSLKIYALLDGYRGHTKVEMDMLAECIGKIAQFAVNNQQNILELEINPLFVYQQEACVVDAVAYTREKVSQ